MTAEETWKKACVAAQVFCFARKIFTFIIYYSSKKEYFLLVSDVFVPIIFEILVIFIKEWEKSQEKERTDTTIPDPRKMWESVGGNREKRETGETLEKKPLFSAILKSKEASDIKSKASLKQILQRNKKELNLQL